MIANLDVEFLSRIQFAFTIMFHYLFPPITIGLGLIMVIIEALWLKTRDERWKHYSMFWTRIFAINFALGVLTGIVMEFEFGTNWATYSAYVGDVFGSALAAEGIFAFFLESGFLAILIFGWHKVSPRVHFFSTLMVFLGSCFSAVWIVVANSWQQTPAGFQVVETVVNSAPMLRAEITDFWAMVFNPSSVIRLTHTLIGCMLLGGFMTCSISAWYLLKNQHVDFAKKCFKIGLCVAFAFSLFAFGTGHFQAKKVAVTQPAKLAAFEAQFQTDIGDAYLFGWPNQETQTVKGGIAIPGLLSFLVHGNTTTPVTGLDAFPEDERPNVWIPFQAFHIMISLAVFFLILTTGSILLLRKQRIFRIRILLWLFVLAFPLAIVANQAGWIAAETGRQPWVVYPSTQDGEFVPGLRTSDALSETVKAEQVLWSIIMFGLIYGLLFFCWLFGMKRVISIGPVERDESHHSKSFFYIGEKDV